MASLILRGDLTADGVPVEDSRLLCIPVLVDAEGRASSPRTACSSMSCTWRSPGHLPEPTRWRPRRSWSTSRWASSARVSPAASAHWRAWMAGGRIPRGVRFVVSPGNVPEDLGIPEITSVGFEEATLQEQRELVAAAQRTSRHERTLLAPSEALNAPRWPEAAHARYREERRRLGSSRHFQADGSDPCLLDRAHASEPRQAFHGVRVLHGGLPRTTPGTSRRPGSRSTRRRPARSRPSRASHGPSGTGGRGRPAQPSCSPAGATAQVRATARDPPN